MAADPTLADRLAIDHQHTMPTTQLRNCTCPVCPDLRAAAVRLRKLDAIEEAAPDLALVVGAILDVELPDGWRCVVAWEVDPDRGVEPYAELCEPRHEIGDGRSLYVRDGGFTYIDGRGSMPLQAQVDHFAARIADAMGGTE